MAKAIHHKEIEAKPVEMDGAKGVSIQWLISEVDNAPNFFMRRFNVEPGGFTPRHQHSHEHEVFILSGSGQVLLESEWKGISEGYVVFVPGVLEHQFKNTGDESLIFLCLVPRS